jgi:hypothetical protein
MGRWEEIEVFVTPPDINGSSLAPRTPLGPRCVATTAVVTHVQIDNDILLGMPDAAGNAATIASLGYNMVRIMADGDDLCIILDAAGTAAPDPAAVGASAGVCEIIKSGQYQDFMVTSVRHKFINVRSRTSAAQMRYRLSAPLASPK